MRLITPKRVKAFVTEHPDCLAQLTAWLKAVQLADWHSLGDVRLMYPHADAVKVSSGNIVTIFNIRGNRYRLITSIKYEWAMIYVLRFLTHAEYDREKWKAEL